MIHSTSILLLKWINSLFKKEQSSLFFVDRRMTDCILYNYATHSQLMLNAYGASYSGSCLPEITGRLASKVDSYSLRAVYSCMQTGTASRIHAKPVANSLLTIMSRFRVCKTGG